MAQTTAGTLISTQTIACPVVAKITLYTVISGSLTALAFVRSNEDCGGDLNDAFFKLPFCPVSLLRLSRVDGVVVMSDATQVPLRAGDGEAGAAE